MSSLLSLGGWSIIPDLVTKHLLDFLYRTPLLSRFFRLTRASPGTPQYRKHYGYTFAFVVLGYLLYNMVQTARTMEPNFYQILGASPNADETELKLAFRQFAKRNHPDRPEVGKNGEERFMMVRDAFEALKDPVVRFAYDRFGPVVLPWRKHCSTMREFLHLGLMRSSIYNHFVTGIFLLFLSAVSQRTPISFWRYILFFALFAAEMALILSPPSTSTILTFFFPYRSTHQHILFLHQLFFFLSIALTRVAPYLLPLDEELNPNVQQALLERIQAVVGLADRETSVMLHTELNSINHPPPSSSTSKKIPVNDPCFARMRPVSQERTKELIAQLTPEMEALIIESNIKQESGPLRSAWDAALRRVSSQPRPNNFWEATTGGDGAGSGYYVVPSASSPIPPSFQNGSPERGVDRDLAEPLVEEGGE